MDAQTNGQAAPQEVNQAVITWLRQNALPIETVKAGNGFSDLQPLKQMLQDVKVVGLGESTHGTREMFQLKHRLVEFLVTEMGFDTFAIEASFAACQPINDYILYGFGERAAVLTGQWYVPWDTEEIADMLDWMRAYNQSVPDEKKVTFYGVDITRNDIGRQAVLDYLRKVAPERVPATQVLFDSLATEEAKWPVWIDQEAEKRLLQLFLQMQEMTAYLVANKESLIARSSSVEYTLALQYTRIMQKFITANVAELQNSSQDGGSLRSTSMAENLIWLVEQSRPQAKFILWEHNYHVSVADTAHEQPNLGRRLREKYGQAYFSFGFEFNQGSFHTRIRLPNQPPGDLKEVTIPPSPQESLAWYLSQAEEGIFMLNVRVPVGEPVVERWLATPQPIHHVGWVYDDTAQNYLELRSVRRFDGIIFIKNTTASRPTANARKTLRDEDGL